MGLRGVFKAIAIVVAMCLATACSAPLREVERARVDELATAIQSLSPDVSPVEASRAAKISYGYPLTLAEQYEITDPPLIHNTKVNMGLRPRGLCWHWANDLHSRLAQERFETLQLHRGIANFDKPLRLEHSTLIISAKGESMFKGIVLDPWREGGPLVWVPTLNDPDYAWRPEAEVIALKRKNQEAELR